MSYLTKKITILGSFQKSLLYLLEINLYTQRNFCDEIHVFLETSVRENVYQIGSLTRFCVMANFRGECIQTHELKKCRKRI